MPPGFNPELMEVSVSLLSMADQTLDNPSKNLNILSMNNPSALILKWCETSLYFLIYFAKELCHCLEGVNQKDIPLNTAEYFSYSSVPRC